jgi:hypothetical protein
MVPALRIPKPNILLYYTKKKIIMVDTYIMLMLSLSDDICGLWLLTNFKYNLSIIYFKNSSHNTAFSTADTIRTQPEPF